MAILNPENWRLKKHEDGQIFGPVSLDKIIDWARTAQVAPQDALTEDGIVWTKAPMVPALQMDWLVAVGRDVFYGPTTSEAVLEFFSNREIQADTIVINCCTGQQAALKDCPFFPKSDSDFVEVLAATPAGGRGTVKMSLQKRILELEQTVMDKRRQLMAAQQTIAKLESRIQELEHRIRDVTSGRSR